MAAGAGERDEAGRGRIARIVLDAEALSHPLPLIEADRARATADLEENNRFVLAGHANGPYVLHLSVQGGRVIFDVRDLADRPVAAHALALGPLRALLRDYEILIDSHVRAVEGGREARIQAIDMGRRGLHNEGARYLAERLSGKVSMDLDTARRLFTLLAALHLRR